MAEKLYGIDVGSTTVKLVVMDADHQMLSHGTSGTTRMSRPPANG